MAESEPQGLEFKVWVFGFRVVKPDMIPRCPGIHTSSFLGYRWLKPI